MDLARAAKFGSVGATGVILISFGSAGLMGMAWADRISGSEGMAIGSMMMVGIAGTAITVLFLFVVIGAFLDRELEARGLGNLEE
ncbi:hypothetical protein [Salinigranum marinum]|uniref:hypothetical protein n=1 Tax=Salinigranum marinum TaxID=1515595 RepID=UPI00298A028E|nr:hypothetical protein [Salinigranum marinum]